MFIRCNSIKRVGLRCISLAGAVCLLGGCNIDGLWSLERQPAGPVTAQSRGTHEGMQSASPVEFGTVSVAEVDLVENVVSFRRQYVEALRRLRAHYETQGNAAKLAWAEFELEGMGKVKPFRYLLDSEVPADSLRPVDRIAEADALYARGLELMRQGGHGVPALFRRGPMVRAAEVFRDLVVRYPTSDKIDDAAFWAGEIHKEYLPNQEQIAVRWYERAWTWDPATPHPARFQAAVVYDYRLHDRDRALELYQDVVTKELGDITNVRFAMRRVHELSRELNAHADAR